MSKLTPEEMFQVSLISEYPYKDIKDVIEEACNHQLAKDHQPDDKLRKKAIASMDNCYLEVATYIKGIVSKQAIPPVLRAKIVDQILALLPDPDEIRKQDEFIQMAIDSLKYCEKKYGHDNMARLNIEAGRQALRNKGGGINAT